MAHPMAGKSAASTRARLKRIGGSGASAGKAWGSTSMSSKTGSSYPSKNAGSQVPYFAAGGSVAPRADRLARGGFGKPKSKGKGKGGGHTNVVIQMPPAGGAGGPQPIPVPVPKPVPVPVPAGGPPPKPPIPPGAPVGGPPMPPPGLGAPGLGAGPMGPPPGLPPGMPMRKRGGVVGYKSGGSVKLADGGEVDEPKMAEEARDAAARRMRRSRSMPNSYIVGDKKDVYKKGGSVDERKEEAEERKAAKQKGNPGEMLKRGGDVYQPEESVKKDKRLGTLDRGPATDGELHEMMDANDLARPKGDPAKKDGYYKRGGTTGADDAMSSKKAAGLGDMMGKKRLGPETYNERDEARYDNYKRGGGIKQGGGGSKQYGEPGGYPVMKAGGGGGEGRLEKARKKDA